MATHQGSTRSSIQTRPGSGLSRPSQPNERPSVTSMTAQRPTNIRMSGPLSRMPTASAAPKMAAGRPRHGREGPDEHEEGRSLEREAARERGPEDGGDPPRDVAPRALPRHV